MPPQPQSGAACPGGHALTLRAAAAGSFVRNTFIHLKEKRSPSLERYHRERKSQSCPPPKVDTHLAQGPPSPRKQSTQSGAQAFPVEFELPEHLHSAVSYVADELQDAMDQIREQGVAAAVVNNVVAAVELGATALPAGVAIPTAPASFWPQWAPAQAPVPPSRLEAQGSDGLWGFVSSIDNAIAGTFDKVADEMKDAAQLIRDQGMAHAVKSAVEHGLRGGGRDVPVWVGPSVKLPDATPEPCGPASSEQLEEKPRQDGPKVGSAELPSRGSKLHGQGCRPCAFAAQGGPSACRNGLECQFCHLCEPGEKKKRRATWQKNKREEIERAAAAAAAAGGGQLLRSVGTAPDRLASLGGDDEGEESPLRIRRTASLHDCLSSQEEPEVLSWADASGY